MGSYTIKKISAIEDGVPIPPKYGLRMTNYPWKVMEINQSFVVYCPTVEKPRLRNSLTSCARSAERKTGRKFVMRDTKDGVRVWRVA